MLKTVLLSFVVLASLVASPVPATAQTTEAPSEVETLAIDTDQVTDRVGLVDPATGTWHLRGAGGATTSFLYGNPGDFPMMGDWDCDGVDTPGLYRQSDGFVYLRNSNTQGVADIRFFFGNPGDIPLAGDFNADGCDTVSIYRASEARIYVINALGANDGGLGAADFNYVFGNPGDKPFVGDFDGNGEDTVGLHRESTGFVYFRNSHTQGNANAEFFFGDPGDRLVAGDWGVVDGTDTPAVFRPSNTTFFFRYTNTQGNADEVVITGQPSYLPVAGRWSQSDNPAPPVPPPPPTISGPLPNALTSYPYSATLTKGGGQGTLTVQKISGPAWVNVSAAGAVTGTPPATAGTTNLGVQVTDARGLSSTAIVPIQVRTGCEGNTTLPAAECLALVQLYRSTNGRNWTDSVGWLSGDPCAGWNGVTCGVATVTQLELDGNNLTGTLPTLSALTGVTILDLRANLIGGSIANAVALPALATLSLDENLFSGALPAGLWTKATLTDLDIADNTFTGSIPGTVNLPNLSTLNLSATGLGGPIPAALWTNSDLLTSVDLSENNFSGGIEASIGGLGSLVDLDLSDNLQLGGLIPDEFLQLAPPVSGGMGSLTNLALNGGGCFTTNMNATLETFLTSLDPEWNLACPVVP